MVSIDELLIVFLITFVVAAALGRSWFHRRWRRPELLRRMCLIAGSALLAANLACFLLEAPELWRTATLTVTLGGHALERSLDAQRGAAFMGLTGMTLYNFTDTDLFRHSQEMVGVIEAAIARYNPDIILTHSNHDQHQDHQAVHMATLRAARQHHSILCYESPSATRDFSPSVFVDIDDYLDAKVQAVKMHSDQLAKPYMTPERVRGIASFRGGQARRRVAEAYEPVRLLSTEMEKL